MSETIFDDFVKGTQPWTESAADDATALAVGALGLLAKEQGRQDVVERCRELLTEGGCFESSESVKIFNRMRTKLKEPEPAIPSSVSLEDKKLSEGLCPYCDIPIPVEESETTQYYSVSQEKAKHLGNKRCQKCGRVFQHPPLEVPKEQKDKKEEEYDFFINNSGMVIPPEDAVVHALRTFSSLAKEDNREDVIERVEELEDYVIKTFVTCPACGASVQKVESDKLGAVECLNDDCTFSMTL
jgi:ribosomal protein S27AE